MNRIAVAALALSLAVACGGRDDLGTGFPPAVEVFDSTGASLGSVALTADCTEGATDNLRLGLALLHNFVYGDAEQAFRTAAEQDPNCVLAHWGIATSLFHPVWPDVPSDEVLERGWAVLQEARALRELSPREEAYIAAAEAYFRDGLARDERSRLTSYAAAWGEAHSSLPDDPEAALLHALALVAAAPGEDLTFANQREAGAMAERVLARIPDHPGGHHYVIHAYDSPPLADRALSSARQYGEVARANAHALHMTSHIFTRLGLWEESIRYNDRSAEVTYEAWTGAGELNFDHLHANDYMVYAHLQRGQDAEARAILEHLRSLDGPIQNHAATAYAFAAVPARIALENGDWAMAAGVQPRWPESVPWDQYPFLEAIPVFARALGAAHTGDIASAHAAHAKLGELRERAARVPIAYDWESQVRIQELAAEAWIAHAEGRTEDALRLMRASADLESTVEKNPVTPGEVLPARELLGDLLMELGRYDEARSAYEAALDRSPNRFNSLYGAGRAAELGGDRASATAFYGRLLEIVGGVGSDRVRLQHARRFVETG